MAEPTKTSDAAAAAAEAAAKSDAESKALAEQEAQAKANVENAAKAFRPKVVGGVKHYQLRHGKHRYTNDAGERVTAVKGDFIPLTDAQLQAYGDRVIHKGSTFDEVADAESVSTTTSV